MKRPILMNSHNFVTRIKMSLYGSTITVYHYLMGVSGRFTQIISENSENWIP